MKRTPTTIALIASLMATPAMGGSAAAQNGQQQSRRPQPPPPPPALYDPQSGPFIVRLNETGQVGDDQLGVIANAVRAWTGPTLQAFVICFHSPRPPIDWHSASNALKLVSNELKAHGAAIVVMPNGGLCDASSPQSIWKDAYVAIMGVVRT